METILAIAYFFFGVFESLTAHYFFGRFFTLKRERKRVAILLYLVRWITLWLRARLFQDITIVFISGMLLLPLVLIPYTAPKRLKFAIGCVYFFLVITSEDILYILWIVLSGSSLAKTLQSLPLFQLSFLLSIPTLLILCWVTLKILRHRRFYSLSTWHWLAIISVPLGSVILIHLFFAIEYYNKPMGMSVLATFVFIILINYFMYFLFDRALAESIVRSENQLLAQQVKYYDFQFEQIKASQKAAGRIRHDMEKHLLALDLDLDAERIDAAKNTIIELIGELRVGEGPANSGNTDIDAILNYKADAAEKNDASMTCDILIPYDLRLNATDMAVIFGNAVDNAIEACQKVDSSVRWIAVAVKYEKSNLYITVENPYAGELTRDGEDLFATSKVDVQLHGIGLRSVREIVNKYDGLLDISTDNQRFVLKIILFNVGE